MKFVLAFALTLLAGSSLLPAAEFALVRDGRAVSSIVLRKDATVVEKHAADELAKKGRGTLLFSVASPIQLDEEAVREAAATGLIVTVEDHLTASGLGFSVAEKLVELQKCCKLIKLGVTSYGGSATPKELYAEYKIDAKGIIQTVESAL